jgi:tetratricopeptide (TPR) repeat protein
MRKHTGSLLSVILLPGLLFHGVTNGQTNVVDSLETVLKIMKEDTSKVKTLNTLSMATLQKMDTTSALKYGSEAFNLADKINYKKGKGIALYRIASAYQSNRRSQEILKTYQQALQVFEEIKDAENAANASVSIARILLSYDEISDGFKYYQNAIQLREKIGDIKGVAKINDAIANYYTIQRKRQEAIRYRSIALKLFQQVNDRVYIALCVQSLGDLHYELGNFTEALDYYSKGLQAWKELGLGYTNRIIILNNSIGDVLSKQDNRSEALKYYKEALRYYKEVLEVNRNPERFKGLLPQILNRIGAVYEAQAALNFANDDEINVRKNIDSAIQNYAAALALLQKESAPDKRILADVYMGLGNLYLRLESYRQAKDYLEKSLQLATAGNYSSISTLHYNLYYIDSTQGRYQNALEHYKEFISYSSSFSYGASTKATERMEYQFSKKEDSLKSNSN